MHDDGDSIIYPAVCVYFEKDDLGIIFTLKDEMEKLSKFIQTKVYCEKQEEFLYFEVLFSVQDIPLTVLERIFQLSLAKIAGQDIDLFFLAQEFVPIKTCDLFFDLYKILNYFYVFIIDEDSQQMRRAWKTRLFQIQEGVILSI